MNCNQAFDILTRGPFPSGNDRDDSAVEQHLAACHECRQLAEALRPAVGLFHEALTGTESLSLPGYRGALQTADSGTLKTIVHPQSVVPRRKTVRDVKPRRKSSAIAWAFAVTCLLGFALGIYGENVRDQLSGETPATANSSKSRGMELHSPTRKGLLLLASLNLPNACHNSGTGKTAAISTCCTHCHAAAIGETVPAASLSKLTKSCVACHSSEERATVSWSLPQLRETNRVAT